MLFCTRFLITEFWKWWTVDSTGLFTITKNRPILDLRILAMHEAKTAKNVDFNTNLPCLGAIPHKKCTNSWIRGQNVQKLQIWLFFASYIASILKHFGLKGRVKNWSVSSCSKEASQKSIFVFWVQNTSPGSTEFKECAWSHVWSFQWKNLRRDATLQISYGSGTFLPIRCYP